MNTDTQRVMNEIESKGYIRPGQTCGNWSSFYKNMGEWNWSRYILYIGGDEIEFTARDDRGALQYVRDTYTLDAEYELFERVCQYRKINAND